MADNKNYDKLALEEMKLLQSIILKHDDIRSKMVGWSVSLVSALSAFYLHEKSGMDRTGFQIVGFSITILFFWLDTIYKVAQDRAINRSRVVEKMIANGEYEGPAIGVSLGKDNLVLDQLRSALNVRVWSPYAGLSLLVLVASNWRT
jgi:hypothetical protein